MLRTKTSGKYFPYLLLSVISLIAKFHENFHYFRENFAGTSQNFPIHLNKIFFNVQFFIKNCVDLQLAERQILVPSRQ